MESVMAFLNMGGYAAYVWPALALAAVVMIGCLVLSLRSLRANEATLGALEADDAGRGEADEDA